MILDLHRQGAGISAIARRTGFDRKTVRKVIATGLEPPAYGPRQPKVTQLQPFERYLRERLAVVREAIKQIMEGGEAAFKLRREKYGF